MARHEPITHQSLSSLLVGVTLAVLVLAAPRATAVELRLTTENDLLVTDHDDLYTFAVALEMQRGPYTLAFRENAFTDRAAGLRFDESQLTAGRSLAGRGSWNVYAEAGLVRVGEGLFGDTAQNAVHRLIGGEEVDLPYIRSSLHGRALVTAERPVALGARLDVGPRFELETIPGLRSHTVLGAQALWRPGFGLTVHFLVGARLTDASEAALERHVEPIAAVARIGVVLHDSIVLTWSSNDYGDGREHLSLGYRVRPGARGKRGE